MSDRYRELTAKIEHYQRMAVYITDGLTRDGINQLIEQARAEKAALHHPENKQQGVVTGCG